MAKAIIDAGICGEKTVVIAEGDDQYQVSLKFETTCPFIEEMANELQEVNALGEISFRRGVPETLQKGIEFCAHTACPVPVGTIKAIEVAAGLALPQDVTIQIEK